MTSTRKAQIVFDKDFGYAVSYQQKRDYGMTTKYLMRNTDNVKFWKSIDGAKKALADLVTNSSLYYTDDTVDQY